MLSNAVLIVGGGLPGTGKTTLSRLLAGRIGAVHLRVDTIEQALVRSGLARRPVGPAGYATGRPSVSSLKPRWMKSWMARPLCERPQP